MYAPSTKLAWLDLPNHARPFGGQIVIDALRRAGRQVADYDGTEADGMLLSLYWCEDLYEWIRFSKRNGVDRARVCIGGNHATGSPRAVARFCGGVYRGDADQWDAIDETNIYRAGGDMPTPCVVATLPQTCTVMEAKAVAKQSFAVMELSRGCKYRCHYCQYAWMKPYREQSADFICGQLATMKGNRCRLSSADIPQHADHARIEEAARASGVAIANQDGALLTVARNGETALGKMQRFGVDGMSERLRARVKKPIKRAWLVERMADYSRRGVTRCLAYNLFGLPTETQDDFMEWDATVRDIVEAVNPPFTWVNSWNAFLPMPMTPLAGAASSWRANNRDLARMAETRLWAKAKGVNVFDMPERTGDRKITERMLAVRATEKTAHIVATVALDPSFNEWAVMKEFRHVEGYDLHGAMPNA